jgi:hypothetical protein
MRPSLTFGIGMLLGAATMMLPRLALHLHAALNAGERAAAFRSGDVGLHTEQAFAFTANAPMRTVAPLFGADRERAWAPGWDPTFVWPAEASDRNGMVFTVAHGHNTAVWLNTRFDPAAGSFQYAYVVPGVMATMITLNLEPEEERTRVTVEYQRTALDPNANGLVQKMAEDDRESGPEWEKQINDYLESLPK